MSIWPEHIEKRIGEQLISPSLHACCGKSLIGDIRLDLYEKDTVQDDVLDMPWRDEFFTSVVCDPPHDMSKEWYEALYLELARVSSKRIIFQHWFLPCSQNGSFYGDPEFKLTSTLPWNKVVISVFDRS